MRDYEEALRIAYAEGWRDPIKVSTLEIEAYKAGMMTERKRVLSILSDLSEGKPFRAIDIGKYLQKIKKNDV